MIFSLENKKKDSIAFLSETGLTVTYGELCSFSGEMRSMTGTGKLAFCLCENSPGSAAGYVAFLNSEVVPFMTDAQMGHIQLKSFLEIYRPDHIWAPSEKTEELNDIFISCDIKGTPVFEKYGYRLWNIENEEETRLNPELALLLATSGSTGSPKLVRLSRKNIESNAEAICEYLDIREDDRPITTLPMNYTYGLSIINSHLLKGASILMTKSSYVQADFWSFFEKGKANTFGGVPYTYQLMKRMRLFRKPVPQLRYITQAGGRLSPELQAEAGAWAKSSGADFFIMYGQTEATARMSYLPAEKCLEKPGSIGVAIPGGRLYTEDNDGNEITGSGVSGELIYEGPNVFLGYAENREDLLKGDEMNGRLRTGDLAKQDEDGLFYIVGRKKRFVKMYGIRVSLDQCENLLKGFYPEAEIVCCGEDDSITVCMTDESYAAEAAERLAEMLKMSSKGFRGVCIKEIPRNSSGKIRYEELTKL